MDLHKSMLDEDIVKYALEHKVLIVTREKEFNYDPAKQRKEDYLSVFIIRHGHLGESYGWDTGTRYTWGQGL